MKVVHRAPAGALRGAQETRQREGGGEGKSASQVTGWGGLLRYRAHDWGAYARLGSRVGRVGRYDRAAAPHVRVDTRSGAFNSRRSARARAAWATPRPRSK